MTPPSLQSRDLASTFGNKNEKGQNCVDQFLFVLFNQNLCLHFQFQNVYSEVYTPSWLPKKKIKTS